MQKQKRAHHSNRRKHTASAARVSTSKNEAQQHQGAHRRHRSRRTHTTQPTPAPRAHAANANTTRTAAASVDTQDGYRCRRQPTKSNSRREHGTCTAAARVALTHAQEQRHTCATQHRRAHNCTGAEAQASTTSSTHKQQTHVQHTCRRRREHDIAAAADAGHNARR